MSGVELYPLGDMAVVVKLGQEIEMETHRLVQQVAAHLEKHPFAGMVEVVPAFTTVTVYYDPVQVIGRFDMAGGRASVLPYERVCAAVRELLRYVPAAESAAPVVVEIPVCYGGEYGPDLEEVARHNGLTPDEVIALHSGEEYTVYMIGFAPGFPYLGGMNDRIAMPRRSSPRVAIPAGSVGIAGEQTGVYPMETPGGWQLIGRTPLELFQPKSDPPSLLQAGNVVRFRPITEAEFARWNEEVCACLSR